MWPLRPAGGMAFFNYASRSLTEALQMLFSEDKACSSRGRSRSSGEDLHGPSEQPCLGLHLVQLSSKASWREEPSEVLLEVEF